MFIEGLSNEVKATVVSGHTNAGQAAVTGTHVDMGGTVGFDSVMFIFVLGTVSAGSVMVAKAQEGNNSGDSDQADIAGTSVSVTDSGGASSNKIAAIVDVVKPQKRFVRPVITPGTANAEIDMIIALQYNARSRPTVQDASVLAQSLTTGV